MNLTLAISFQIFFILVLILSTIRPKYLADRRVQLLRVLYPSWRFFDEIDIVPVLFARHSNANGEFGDWQNILPKKTRNWTCPILNPQGNLLAASHSLLQQLITDLNDWQDPKTEAFSETVSLKLVRNLVFYQINSLNPKLIGCDFSFQFKISAWTAERKSREYSESTLENILSLS